MRSTLQEAAMIHRLVLPTTFIASTKEVSSIVLQAQLNFKGSLPSSTSDPLQTDGQSHTLHLQTLCSVALNWLELGLGVWLEKLRWMMEDCAAGLRSD